MTARLRVRTFIGMDIGSRTIKAAQLSLHRGRWRLRALSVLPRADAEKPFCSADALALRKVLKRQGFSGRKIVVAAPDDKLLRAALEVPSKVSGAPIRQIARMELSRLHDVRPDSFEVVHWEFKTPDGSKPTTQTLAFGCPHEAANTFLDLFETSGFDVVALDVRSAAVLRACEPLILPAPEITTIVDLGWHSTSTLFVCGASVIYERRLGEASAADLMGRLVDAFGIPPESAHQVINTVGLTTTEATDQFDRKTAEVIRRHLTNHIDRLLEALRVPLSYASHQFPSAGVKRMLLIGGGAAVPGLAPYMQEQLGFEVRTAAPSDLIEGWPELLAKAGNPAATVAVGLARFGGG